MYVCGIYNKKNIIPFWCDDTSVSIPSNSHDCQRRQKNWHLLSRQDKAAKRCCLRTKRPLLEQHFPKVDRQGYDAKEKVGKGQSPDEGVVDRPHVLAPEHRDDDEDVATAADADDHDVQDQSDVETYPVYLVFVSGANVPLDIFQKCGQVGSSKFTCWWQGEVRVV